MAEPSSSASSSSSSCSSSTQSAPTLDVSLVVSTLLLPFRIAILLTTTLLRCGVRCFKIAVSTVVGFCKTTVTVVKYEATLAGKLWRLLRALFVGLRSVITFVYYVVTAVWRWSTAAIAIGFELSSGIAPLRITKDAQKKEERPRSNGPPPPAFMSKLRRPSTQPVLQPTTKVCIVGAGASGVAAAYALSQQSEGESGGCRVYEVEVYETCKYAGGVATSEMLPGSHCYINDGVQGGAPSYRNTTLLHETVLGVKTHRTYMRISFGQGEYSWTNDSRDGRVAPIIERHQKEIKRLGTVLWLISHLELVFAFIPISKVLDWFRFSQEFQYRMVYPLVALFFGTGNRTPDVSSAMFSRVFYDPKLRLFEYDPKLLLSQTPEMFAFDRLKGIYASMVEVLEERGVKFRFHSEVTQVIRTGNSVFVKTKGGGAEAKQFDYIIFACSAENALKLLSNPTVLEKSALGNVQYFDDITVTHEDTDYMRKHYTLTAKDQYFVRNEEDPRKIEMSFNLNNYQPQLGNSSGPVWQTIFMDATSSDMWTINEIDEDSVILRKWWRQFGHTWKHYAFTVPLLRFIQGKNRTVFAGAYTLVNTHEVATMSGLAAAYRLGVEYPFNYDSLAREQFDLYLSIVYGRSRG